MSFIMRARDKKGAGRAPKARESAVIHTAGFRLRAGMLGLLGLLAAGLPGDAQQAQTPSWIVPELLDAAKKEGTLTIYSSMNEQEGFPLWKLFEEATGIKTEYVRATDNALMARIAIERRAQQRSWDVMVTTAVSRLPQEYLEPIDPPLAKDIKAQARDPNRRWYGVYANYNTPAYNTKLVKEADLPKSYEEFAQRKEWAGKVAIDLTDGQWLSAMYTHYGEERAKKIISDIVAALQPVTVDGHLALARSVGAGEYWVALNNYASLTSNVKIAGGDTDYWVLDPVALFYGQVGVNTLAPHPNAAKLAANFLLSKEAQQMLPKAGRLPVRADVTPNPPDSFTRLEAKKVILVQFPGDEEKKWLKLFQDLFKPR
jgi:iron(III) transport system substrate-binding protein